MNHRPVLPMDDGGHGEPDAIGEAVEAAAEHEDNGAYPLRISDEILDISDPRRMLRLTRDEYRMAVRIKEAVRVSGTSQGYPEEIHPVSDFLYAQMSLMEGISLEDALERLYKLQCFRQEYGVRDTAEEGTKALAAYMKLMPQFNLGFTFQSEIGQYVIIYDNKRFLIDNVKKGETQMQQWMRGVYYSASMISPDLEAVRRGTVLVVECEGYDWKANIDIHCLRRVWEEVGGVYPCKITKIKHFHNNVAMTLLTSMMRPLCPKHLQQKLEFGCQYTGGNDSNSLPQRLDELYLVPTVEAANERFLQRVQDALSRRYANEQAFKL